MRFISTRGTAPPASLEEAVLRGLAPDGGLYMPQTLPRMSPGDVADLRGKRWPDVSSAVARHLLSDTMDKAALDDLLRESLNFPIPLICLKDRIHILELFHGPTLAFKDVGARFMAGLMTHFRGRNGGSLTVLAATSGDTGGAVAHAFHGLPGVRVIILFPAGKVSPRQERQFSTLGGNVVAVAVQGDFDDCQRLAKGAFEDPSVRHALDLTSANSINVGRLIPQMFYYFQAGAQLAQAADGHPLGGLLFSVPSGNLGNLAAGLMANAIGLGQARFLGASNVNDGLPRYLRTGRFTPRASVSTHSSAMDVGNPSNLARIRHLYSESFTRLKTDLAGRRVSDLETRECIRRVYDETGYVLDPHSAVGLTALEWEMEARPETTGVLLATAHPAKFAEIVEPILGESLPLPPQLAPCLERDRMVTPMPPEEGALKELLLEE